MLQRCLLFLLFAVFAAGCRNNDTVIVNGTVENPKGKYMKLWRVDVNKTEALDSAKIKSNGSFRFKFSVPQSNFYQVGNSATEFITLVIHPGERILLGFNGPVLHRDYTVTGSDDSEKVRLLDARLRDTRRQLDSLRTDYEALSDDPAGQQAADSIEAIIVDVINGQRNFSIDFILKNLGSLSSIMAIYQKFNEEAYVLYETRDLQLMKLLTDTLTVKYPKSQQVKAMEEDLKRELNNMQVRQFSRMVESMEPSELNPELTDINGRQIALSSLRGKYVLVTFWSAESPDCIRNNLELKEHYKTYNRRGFEIYQINIDADEERWKAAVRFDELPWISVREDDPSNLKYAYIYNVQSLPANYLYDPQGEIIGTNLFGRTLAIKLEQLFGQLP
ncbi:MAG: TlpA disulfide reductase family protein [Bacteroidales bacterium]